MAKPEKPRWGKINHGQTYGLLADDIGRRLATIRLGDYERLLLNHIREHSWARSTRRKEKGGGWPDALPFEATITVVANDIASGIVDEPELKYLRKKLYEAAASLKRDNILKGAEFPAEGLLINTNCDEWRTFTREFLPTGAGVAYAMKARSGGAEDDAKVSPQEDTAYPFGRTSVSFQKDICIPPKGYAVSPGEDTDVLSKGYGPIEERTSEEFKKTPEDKRADAPAAPPQPPMATGKSLGVVNRPAASEPIANTPAEVERAAGYARTAWGDRAECSARSDCEDFWAVDVLEAMKKATANGANGYPYAARVLRSWWTETAGRPKHTPACKVRPPAPEPVLSEEDAEVERVIARNRAAALKRKLEAAEAARRGILPMKSA